MSQKEVKLILKTPPRLKHRVLFAIIYDCGLRISEAINLKITDIDFDRSRVHIRQSKHKKDRYVLVSSHTLRGLQKYLEVSNPREWLFNGELILAKSNIINRIHQQTESIGGKITVNKTRKHSF